MNSRRVIDALGLALLAGAVLWSVVHVLDRTAAELAPGTVVLRFSHWQVEGGMREAFDAVARQYEREHPNVRVIQIPVPGRVYGTYINTQLAGDEPPDMMELSPSDEVMARYFVALTPWVEKPNPYNKGTDLENVPWRDTFLDGLSNDPGLNTLLDNYVISPFVVTSRMYYNRDLYRQIVGSERTPRNYREFLQVCDLVREFARKNGRELWPIAGSRFAACFFQDKLFRSQTQKLALEVDPRQAMRPPGVFAFLSGRASLDSPEIRDALRLMREAAMQMQVGFMQFDRDESIFLFGQQKALMLPTGSWDYISIKSQSPFEVGVFTIPIPGRDDPEYGQYVLGPVSEAVAGGMAGLMVTLSSQHRAEAIDFLQFLTSRRGDQIFADRSCWLPSVVGVKTAAEVRAFEPVVEGYPDGFEIAPLMWGSGELFRIQANYIDLLFNPGGSVDKFVEKMRPEMDQAVRDDAARRAKDFDQSVRRLDTSLEALEHLDLPADERARRRSSLWETQNGQEVLSNWVRCQLAHPAKPAAAPGGR